jgi:preprotein translocase subunit SecE
MDKIKGFVAGFSGFVDEVKVEIKKSSWPNREELVNSTIVVIVSVALLGAFVGVSDWLLAKLMQVII